MKVEHHYRLYSVEFIKNDARRQAGAMCVSLSLTEDVNGETLEEDCFKIENLALSKIQKQLWH